ncbi:hypothetical protein LWI28_003771 [Acer negundo]|uniref:Uncharacterized protein n=1 Tax=Acer negundo TaxID=4023 RepID=A0AAD5JIJ0_ACENE|nr:hypothetical protein LWI28_003771 [Acer negundo]
MGSGHPSGILPEVNVSVLVGDTVMGQTNDANVKQTSVIPPRTVPAMAVPTVQVVEELTQAFIAMERQSWEISRLKKRLTERDQMLESALTEKLQLQQGFEMSKEWSPKDVCRGWDGKMRKYKVQSLEVIKNQRMRWQVNCKSIEKEPHVMHLELPSKSSLITFHANEKADILGEKVDVGPLPDSYYFFFMVDDPDDISWLDFKDLTKGYRYDPSSGTSVGLPTGSKPRGSSGSSKA